MSSNHSGVTSSVVPSSNLSFWVSGHDDVGNARIIIAGTTVRVEDVVPHRIIAREQKLSLDIAPSSSALA